jgi:putative ABC transport system permease protein
LPFATDFVQTLRSLSKHPTQSLVIFFLIAIGIGVSTAFYSVSEALLLRPLSFDRDGRLVAIEQKLQPSGSPLMNSHQNLNELREESTLLEGVAVYTGSYGSLVANGQSEYAQGLAVDRFFLPLLGVSPALGRGFSTAEEQDGSPCTIILSDAFWKRHFEGDKSIVGQNILSDKRVCTVIGIMPQSFHFPFRELSYPQEDYLLPLQDHSSLRGNYDKYGIARIKAGTSLQLAQTEIALLAAHISQTGTGHESHAFILRPYRELIVSDYLPLVRLLAGVIVCVLLVICINVASLLLVDAIRSRKEVEIRFALGGSRWQIARVFLLRAVVLSFAGGIAGSLLAWALVILTRRILPAGFPDADQIGLNLRLLGFVASISLGTGMLSGVLPAIAATQKLHKISLSSAGQPATSFSIQKSRSCLVVLQLGFSATFLVVAGLLGISLYRLLNVDPGIQMDHRLVVIVKPSDIDLKTADALQLFFMQINEQLSSIPGVTEIAESFNAPLGAHGDRDFHIKNRPLPEDSREWMAQANAVSSNYFHELGMSVRKGRSFAGEDRKDGRPVAIVNGLFASHFFGQESPLGKEICVPSGRECLWREIVGVVADVRDNRIDSPPVAAYFIPYSQAPPELLGSTAFTVQTNIPPAVVLETIQKKMSILAPRSVSMGSFTLEEMRSRQMVVPRARLWLIAAFAFMSLALTAMGVYGIIAVTVEERTREIGIRVAMGATPQRIAALFNRRMLFLLVPGLLLGMAGAVVAVRYITSALFGTSPINPMAYCGSALVLSAVATIATFLPVRRALEVNAAEALRTE